MRGRATTGHRGGAAFLVVGLAAALVLAACGSTTPGVTAGPRPAATAAASAVTTAAPPATEAPRPTGPAPFNLTVAGDPNVTGTWSGSFGVSCNNPTFSGLSLLFFAQSPDGKAVVLVTLTPGSIGVSERAGAGAAYTDREFTGTGVSALDPTRGGTFDSDVTIVPAPNSNPGTLGTITHVAGSVDCGDQVPGTTTVVASGSSAEGTISGPFTAARVTCNSSAAYGNSAHITAVMGTATPPVYLIINLPANGKATIFSISESPNKQHTYQIDPAGSVAVTATGGHVDADFIEVVDATKTPHVIHLAGDATCGTFNKN